MLVQFSNTFTITNKYFTGDNSKHSTVYTSTTCSKLIFTDERKVVLILCYLPPVEGRPYFRNVVDIRGKSYYTNHMTAVDNPVMYLEDTFGAGAKYDVSVNSA